MSKHILVIDDNEDFRNYLKKLLTINGYYIVTAEDGVDALSKMKSTIPDLIITDIIMPGMDGLEVVKQIKGKYPEIKIMAISGGGRIEPDMYLGRALKLEADSVLKKPFKKEVLLNNIDSLLSEI